MIKHCKICGSLYSGKQLLCQNCLAKIEKDFFDSYLSRCPDCNYPLISKDYECLNCKDKENNYEILNISDYKSDFSRFILEDYKFYYRKEMSKVFAFVLSKYIKSDEVVVPVPCSKQSFKKRGWDQMKEVCKQLHKKYYIKYADLLENTSVSVKQQKELTKKEREIEAMNKYVMKHNSIDKMSKIVVIDDVCTTGSTIKSCIRTLKEAGFSNVRGLTWFLEF